MQLDRIIILEVLNWEKYNPRNDVKKHSWFRFENTTIDGPDFFDFDHSELCFWIYCLSLASKKQSGEISINVPHAVVACKFQKETICSAIDKLERLQCVRVVSGITYVGVSETHMLSCPTNEHHETRRDERTDEQLAISEKISKPKKPTADSADAEIKNQAAQVIARYCELWKARYKTSSLFSGKWAGNAKTLVKDHGLNRSLALVEAFLEMNDSHFIGRRHSFETILTHLAQVTHYAGTGITVTNTQLNQLDKTQTNKNSIDEAKAHFAKVVV